jgi:hypothetical protein
MLSLNTYTMPEFVCNISSPTKNLFTTFFDLDKAFDYIIEQLILEGDMEKGHATSLMTDVKKIYIDKGNPGNFNVWEVESQDGTLVRMFINEIL